MESLLESATSLNYHNIEPEKIDKLYEVSKSYLYSSSSLNEEQLYLYLQQHFYLALISGQDNEAKLTLQRIIDRFSDEPSKVAILKSQYLEATEGPTASQKYLSSRPANDFDAFKRKTVLLKQEGNYEKYIEELNRYVEICPTDSETLAELAEAYFYVKAYDQAVHAYEEVIILVPLAYNIFARIGEILHIQATVSLNVGEQLNNLKGSIKHFLRSVELCPAYVRGWAGTYVVTGKLLHWPKLDSKDKAQYERILGLSRKKLAEMVEEKKNAPLELEAAKRVLEA